MSARTVFTVSLLCLAALPARLPAQDDTQAFKQEVKRVIDAQNAYLETERKNRQESYERLSGDLEATTTALREIQKELAAARAEMAAIRKENAELKRTLLLRDDELASRLNAEAKARADADQKVVDTITRKLETIVAEVNRATGAAISAANDAARQASQARASQPPARPSGGTSGGSYIEITVEKGDTLSAIASAAGVSVAQIKAANNLTSDTIRVGQKLKIPQ